MPEGNALQELIYIAPHSGKALALAGVESMYVIIYIMRTSGQCAVQADRASALLARAPRPACRKGFERRWDMVGREQEWKGCLAH